MSQLPIERSAVSAVLTSHAMLVLWGLVAQKIGLLKALESVPIPQRSREHTPQSKLILFLVSILSGCAYLQDISRGPHPLGRDAAVARAWGQPGWADYSGVSRTLSACDERSVAAVREALDATSRPFIEQEVIRALRDQGRLIYDGDLTGRPVSNTSTTYPDVAFGWMGDGVHLGYQAALVSLHSPTYGRLWLSVKRHPGDTVSSSQAKAMIRAAEVQTRIRPRRRTDLLTRRIEQHREFLWQEEEKMARARERAEEAQQRLAQVEQEQEMWAQKVAELEAVYQERGRPERPYSQLAQARRKLGVRERRVRRWEQELERACRRYENRQAKVSALWEELEQLEERLAQFEEDNRTNIWPIRAVFRLDGGFGSGSNVALLIEMGYDVYTKATNHQIARALRRRVGADTVWARVGKNAAMTAWEGQTIANCPYPLDVALERFHTGEKEQYSVLLHYGEEPVTTNLEEWFTFYNSRQTIEAGIKEGKNVFQMHHLKVRSAAGLEIQEAFAAFAANFVRWAAAWLCEINPTAPPPFNRPQPSVKQMVRVAANTSAWVIWQPGGCLLMFTDTSVFADTELLVRGTVPIQLALPLFESRVFSPI